MGFLYSLRRAAARWHSFTPLISSAHSRSHDPSNLKATVNGGLGSFRIISGSSYVRDKDSNRWSSASMTGKCIALGKILTDGCQG